ncbi:MAG: hypothetical protein ABIY51_04280 [Ferruginibacter sp.]
MKTFVLSLALCFLITSVFAQTINVPDFVQPDIKTFYTEYSNHLIKCIEAIREKNESKATALFKAGEPMVARSRIMEKKVIMNPVEKKKWMLFASQVYPYIKEMERSPYYQKLYGKK